MVVGVGEKQCKQRRSDRRTGGEKVVDCFEGVRAEYTTTITHPPPSGKSFEGEHPVLKNQPDEDFDFKGGFDDPQFPVANLRHTRVLKEGIQGFHREDF